MLSDRGKPVKAKTTTGEEGFLLRIRDEATEGLERAKQAAGRMGGNRMGPMLKPKGCMKKRGSGVAGLSPREGL